MKHATYRRALALAAGAALAATTVLVGTGTADAATTITVGNPARCGTTDFRTISEAVAAASSGDTISVCAGNYGESVVIDKPGLTLNGAAAGIDARGKRPAAISSTVGVPGGAFTLTGNADDTVIDGFVISGVTNYSQSGVNAFQGASGLQLLNNVIQFNANGLRLSNPDGSNPALVFHNNFNRNSAGYEGGGDAGSGIFICCGAANSTTITENVFKQHTQTAINFAGDGSNPSRNLVVSDNKSTDDATFVVATNSVGAVIDHNIVTTSPGVLGGIRGTAILDFGSNLNLRIVNNTMKATGTTTSSGINLSNFTGTPSDGTTVTGNTVTGWNYDLRIRDAVRAYAAGNKLTGALTNGIQVEPPVSGALLSHNTVQNAVNLACVDQSTGNGTAGTANTWLVNKANTASTPLAICSNSSVARR